MKPRIYKLRPYDCWVIHIRYATIQCRSFAEAVRDWQYWDLIVGDFPNA